MTHRAPRAAFTLVEIMVSILILSVISIAMVTIFQAAVTIYQQGEFTRASNDEALAVMGMLRGDLARAVPTANGGEFYAYCDTVAGHCVVGWTIEHPEAPVPDDRHRFVVWWVDVQDAADTRDDVLRRAILPSIASINQDNPIGGLGGTPVTTGVVHFSVWLLGTSHQYPSGSGQFPRSTLALDWWDRVLLNNPTAPVQAAEPLGPGLYYTTDNLLGGGARRIPQLPDEPAYPLAARFQIILTGGGRFGPRSQVVGSGADASATAIRILGVNGISITPGSVARVGDEIIGYRNYDDNLLIVNDAIDDGPVRPDPNNPSTLLNGRGVFRSQPQNHAPGTEVTFGRSYALTHSFPRQ